MVHFAFCMVPDPVRASDDSPPRYIPQVVQVSKSPFDTDDLALQIARTGFANGKTKIFARFFVGEQFSSSLRCPGRKTGS